VCFVRLARLSVRPFSKVQTVVGKLHINSRSLGICAVLKVINSWREKMYSPTVIALIGFIAWSLALLVLMELIRSKMVLCKEIAPNEFNPTNSNLSGFMQRLARAHANCIEGLPIFGGLLIVAYISSNSGVTDSLAFAFLGARVVQTLIHLISLSPVAVTARFTAFAVQLVIGVYWCYALMSVSL
jgi:uncharacterized MAPEG superfamily protein